MIFTMDVGNTNIKTALFEGREMRNYWRISTNTSYTSDEYGLILEGLFARAGLSLGDVEGIVMSSVVPGRTSTGAVSALRKRHFLAKPSAFRSRAHTRIYKRLRPSPSASFWA